MINLRRYFPDNRNGAKAGKQTILVINLKAAKALGLAVPPTLLARADEVLEWARNVRYMERADDEFYEYTP